MSAQELRKAAENLRKRAETEAVLRDGDPYYTTEASAWERLMHPGVGLLLAGWLEDAAAWEDAPNTVNHDMRAHDIARLINGNEP